MESTLVLRELEQIGPQVEALFRRSFEGRAAPRVPRHYVAFLRATQETFGYIHYHPFEPGVYLCGGLCVDASLYRRLGSAERDALRKQGSLSRWLIRESTAALEDRRAVFAFTGNTLSRRDALALGYVSTAPYLHLFSRARRHLLVQWHATGEEDRKALVRRVASGGPF